LLIDRNRNGDARQFIDRRLPTAWAMTRRDRLNCSMAGGGARGMSVQPITAAGGRLSRKRQRAHQHYGNDATAGRPARETPMSRHDQ